MQKGQLTQCTQQIRVVGTITFSAKRSAPMQGTQRMQHTVDAVCNIQWHSGIWWWDIVFGAKRSNQWMQWMQWTQYTVHSGIVVYGDGDIVFGAKRSNQWMQYAVCSEIVVYGGGDIVFGAKRSNTVDAVCSGHSTQWNSSIWWWGHCLWCKRVKPVDALYAVCSGHSTYTLDAVDAVE